MAKAWKDVISSQQYQSLAPDQKAQAQEQYFNEVVAPQAGDKAEEARQQFFSAYPIPVSEPGAIEQQKPVEQQQTTAQQIGDGLAETWRGLLQAAINVGNIPASITDAVVGAGAGVGKFFGLGDGSYPTAPRVTTEGLEKDFGLQPGTLTPQTTEGKVFSEALPYLTPVGIERAAVQAPSIAGRIVQSIPRLTAESAAGTLASNSEQNDASKLASDLATNVAVGGGVSALGGLIGSGYRAVKGSIAPEAQQAIRFAEQNNAPLLTTDVVQPGTFSGRSAQALGEKVPITGTGSVRRAQQEVRGNLIDQYAQRFDAPAPDEIVSSLQRQTSKVKSAAGERLSDVNAAMQSAGQIRPDNAIKVIDNEISRLSRLGGAADNQTISKLKVYRDELDKGADFGLLRDLRTQFRQDVKGDRIVWPNQSEASVNKVYSSLTGDLNKAVSDRLGSQAASRYNQANAVYANEANLVKNTRLKNVLQKGELTPEVVNSLLFSNKPSEVRQLYASLDSRGRSAARASVIGKAYEKSAGSPDRFLNELNRLSSQTGIIFKGTDRQYLNGLKTYLDQTRRASRAGAVTPTGQELFQVAVPAGIASDVVGTGGVGTATGLGYGALARVYESAPVRNAMLRLANTPRGSTAFEKNLQAVEDAVSAVTRASVSAD